jgi:5-methylthioadenosine/S-adenosylhomocysteine deaminase
MAGASRPTKVILVARSDADGPAACVEALQRQGVTSVVVFHSAAPAESSTARSAPCDVDSTDGRGALRDPGQSGSNIAVCVPDVASDRAGASSIAAGETLRRDVEALLLVRAIVVPQDTLRLAAPALAGAETDALVSADVEYCAVWYSIASGAEAPDRAIVEGQLVTALSHGIGTGICSTSLLDGRSLSVAASAGSLTSLLNARCADDMFAEPCKRVVDLMIASRWVIPIEPDEKTLLHNHAVVIDAGKVVAVLPISEADSMYDPRVRLDRRHHVTMPGLINAHTHTGMTLMRNRADDEPLMKWLRETVWPLEGAFVGEDGFCEDGALVAVAEMLRGGVTTFSDMYWFPENAAKVALRVGMRAVIGMILIGFPSVYAASADEYIEKGHAVRDKFAGESTLHFTYAPHAPYTVPDSTWERLHALSKATSTPIHTHLHETADECVASTALDRSNTSCHQSEHACRPLENFHRMGILSPRLIAVHMTQLSDADISLCAAHSVNVVHCPSSNAKLASGFCPVSKLIDAGVNVALGTDSAGSNNSLDLFQEMKLAALMAKNLVGDARVVPAATAIRMATRNGAVALGIGEITGSLLPGKAADVICVTMGKHARNSPVFDVRSALVYSSSRNDVTDVFVEGNQLLKDSELDSMDENDIVRRAHKWESRINAKFPPPWDGSDQDIVPSRISPEERLRQDIEDGN